MTKLGKVFTVLVLSMSTLFFVVAIVVNSTHVDYSAALNDPTFGLKAVATREQSRVRELQELVEKQKQAVAVEIAARQSALAALQVQLEQLDFDVQQKQTELAAKQAELTQVAKAEQASQDELVAQSKLNEEARKAMLDAQAQRDASFVKFRDAYGELLKLQGEYKTLQMQVDQMTKSPSNQIN